MFIVGPFYRDNAGDERAGDDIVIHHGQEVGRQEDVAARAQPGSSGLRRRSPPNQQQEQPAGVVDNVGPIAQAGLGMQFPGPNEGGSRHASTDSDDEDLPPTGGAQGGPNDGVQPPQAVSPLIQEVQEVRQNVRQAAAVAQERIQDLVNRRLV